MTKDEALKLALKRLEYWYDHADCLDDGQAITAIKEALAQPEQDGQCKHCTDGCPACDARKLPEQEPVAWCVYCDGQFNLNIFRVKDVADVEKVRLDLEYPNHNRKVVPLYTTPPQPKQEQEPVCDKDPQGCWNVRCQLGKKCKNTPPQRNKD